jgi:hypothetical protein
VFYTNKPVILLIYKETYFNGNNFDHVIPSVVVFLLQEFEYEFPEDIPSTLPPLKRIEYQIDLVPRAVIPN